MPYNQKLADLYNELAEQYPGLSENGLRSLAGIAISDGDYTLIQPALRLVTLAMVGLLTQHLCKLRG